MKIHHRPGDPRTEPPINPWASDPEPGRVIALWARWTGIDADTLTREGRAIDEGRAA